jgi:hypothetical protein
MHSQVIARFCREPRTVRAVAEQFEVPLQVAKILVADLVVAGVLHVQAEGPQRPDLRLLDRVLEGLAP